VNHPDQLAITELIDTLFSGIIAQHSRLARLSQVANELAGEETQRGLAEKSIDEFHKAHPPLGPASVDFPLWIDHPENLDAISPSRTDHVAAWVLSNCSLPE